MDFLVFHHVWFQMYDTFFEFMFVFVQRFSWLDALMFMWCSIGSKYYQIKYSETVAFIIPQRRTEKCVKQAIWWKWYAPIPSLNSSTRIVLNFEFQSNMSKWKHVTPKKKTNFWKMWWIKYRHLRMTTYLALFGCH